MEILVEEYLEEQIGPLLNERDCKLVAAESCTGGLISHRITNIPGSSEYYIGGVCAYAYEAKRSLLGVSPNTLIKYGAVSRQTVLEMAIGVRRLFSDEVDFEKLIGISISGIAGPGGGMPNKPVGLVWVGLSTIDGDWARKKTFGGNRIQNKESSSDFALSILLEYLEGKFKPKKRGD